MATWGILTYTLRASTSSSSIPWSSLVSHLSTCWNGRNETVRLLKQWASGYERKGSEGRFSSDWRDWQWNYLRESLSEEF